VSSRIVSICTVEWATYTTPRTCSRLHGNMRMGGELGGWVVPLLIEGFDRQDDHPACFRIEPGNEKCFSGSCINLRQPLSQFCFRMTWSKEEERRKLGYARSLNWIYKPLDVFPFLPLLLHYSRSSNPPPPSLPVV
jgi:hypothetical protein